MSQTETPLTFKFSLRPPVVLDLRAFLPGGTYVQSFCHLVVISGITPVLRYRRKPGIYYESLE